MRKAYGRLSVWERIEGLKVSVRCSPAESLYAAAAFEHRPSNSQNAEPSFTFDIRRQKKELMTPAQGATDVFSPLIEQAIELAAQWHDGMYRKRRWRDPAFEVPSGATARVPVMAHVTSVAMTVQRAGWDDATVAAAYLHDVIEDANRHGQHLRFEQLRDALGETVAAIVEGVTERMYDADGNRRSWHARKRDYVDQLRVGRVESMAVSLADKLHNLWTINQGLAAGNDVFSRGTNGRGFNAGPEQQLWLHRAVMKAAIRHDDARLDPIQKRLRQEVEQFEAHLIREGYETS